MLTIVLVLVVVLIAGYSFWNQWKKSASTAVTVGQDTCSRVVPGGSCRTACEPDYRDATGGICPKQNNVQLKCCEPLTAAPKPA